MMALDKNVNFRLGSKKQFEYFSSVSSSKLDSIVDNKKIISKEYNVWTKAGCTRGRTYDVDFCSRVCELGHNQICSPLAGPGVDVCGVGTRCIKQMTGEYRCQADKQVRIN